ncbi:hypothetical protein EGO58_12140 [Limosilactobacillus reuteri]|nr:hypothetical protein EGO58_12140 [Limosilactobacillus reuteri]
MDPELQKIRVKIQEQRMDEPDFTIADDGALLFQGRLCVPNDMGIQDKIIKEAYSSENTLHLRSTKMYKDFKQSYRWPG